jgi:hypothetical protein
MDDLQLAVETVLLDRPATGDDVTLEATVDDDSRLVISIGPLAPDGRGSPPASSGRLDFEQLLGTLVEHASAEERLGETWFRIEKRIPTRSQ